MTRTVAGRSGRLSAFLSTALLPPTCCLCGSRGLAPNLDLCDICLAQLPRAPTESAGTAAFRFTVVPYLYEYPVAHFVRALKFDGERLYARVLGTLLADARREVDAPLPECIIPIPLHPTRYRERGFNQSHELARFAAEKLGLPVDAQCLERALQTREQSGLTLAERRRNVRGAFRALHPPEAQRVALIDDVLTTGSTIREAAKALRQTGVKEIELWAAARAVLRK